ncbi:MAG: EamA family transporter, partial [Ilumatobacter sp.]
MPGPTARTPSGAFAAVAGSAALFGLTGTVAALGPDDLSPVTAGVWRSVIGGVCLLGLSAWRRMPISRYPLRNPWILIGAIGVAAYQLAFFEAVDRTGVALGTLVTIGAGPPVAGLLDWFVSGRRPSRSWMFGSTVAIAGVALLSGGSDGADATGIAFALVAATSFPLYGNACQRLMHDRPFLPAMATVFGAGFVLLIPLAVVSADDVLTDGSAVVTVVVLGVVTLAMAYVLWGVGLQALSLSVVVTTTLLEPAVAAALAVTVLDEPASVGLAAGLVLVATGVLISSRP